MLNNVKVEKEKSNLKQNMQTKIVGLWSNDIRNVIINCVNSQQPLKNTPKNPALRAADRRPHAKVTFNFPCPYQTFS